VRVKFSKVWSQHSDPGSHSLNYKWYPYFGKEASGVQCGAHLLMQVHKLRGPRHLRGFSRLAAERDE